MSDQDFIFIFIVLGCAGVSFLMSGMESGVLALSPLRIRQLRRAGNRRAEVLQGFLQNPENFLWTILVGNTVANFTVIGSVAAFLMHSVQGSTLLRAGIFASFIFVYYVVGELLPKTIFRLFPNRLCMFLARPFRILHFLLTPIVAVVAWSSRWLVRWTGGRKFTGNIFGNRDELRFIMQESGQALTSEEKTMINRVLDLQNIRLRQITVPLGKVSTVEMNTSVAQVLNLARERRFTRFPVWKTEGKQRKIAGIVSLKTLLYSNDFDEQKTAGAFLKPALFLNESLRLEDALNRLRRSGQRMAVVQGRDQREIGIVTLQDILKAIFGEVTL